MTTQVYVLVVAAVVAAVLVALVYNTFVQLRNKVQEAFSIMDVYLKKRYDLIPNLVAVVKGYASHEAETLEAVAKMRGGVSGRDEQLDSEMQITSALTRIMAVVEAYPQLKADSNFLQLQTQLAQLEEDIASARRYYNGAVREFNNKCQTVPNNIFASLFGFKPMPMFEAKSTERVATKVEI